MLLAIITVFAYSALEYMRRFSNFFSYTALLSIIFAL